jgi:hypothetical protein
MINVCTIADSNFALRVLALRESIAKHTKDYTLNLLCLDDKIYNRLNNKYPDVRCFNIGTLLEEDTQLARAKENEPSYEALNVAQGNRTKAQELQFIWALASYFSWYCLENLKLEDIFYVDADIYFFNNIEYLDDLKTFGSIGLIENRVPNSTANGRFNVGIIYFKNDQSGLPCCEFWKNCLLNEENEYKEEYGVCGDQKYLELFHILYENVFIFDDFIGHLAPWSVPYHQFVADKVIWEGKTQDMLFYHFSNFNYDFEKGAYIPARRHNLLQLVPGSPVHALYEEYYNCLERLNEDCIWHDSV